LKKYEILHNATHQKLLNEALRNDPDIFLKKYDFEKLTGLRMDDIEFHEFFDYIKDMIIEENLIKVSFSYETGMLSYKIRDEDYYDICEHIAKVIKNNYLAFKLHRIFERMEENKVNYHKISESVDRVFDLLIEVIKENILK